MRFALFLPLLVGLGACGGSRGDGIADGTTPTEPASAGTSSPTRTCTDASGRPSACAVTPSATRCARDATATCLALVREEVSTGTEGPCLLLAFENRCNATVYSDVRIERTNRRGKLEWQGWTSTTLAGAPLSLSACGASGRYLVRSSLDDAALDVVASQCPPPP